MVAINGERVAVGTIGQFLKRRSIGAFLLFLALPMAPPPGPSVLFCILLILVSAELMSDGAQPGYRRVSPNARSRARNCSLFSPMRYRGCALSSGS